MNSVVVFCAILAANFMVVAPASSPASQPQSRPARAQIAAEVFAFPERLGKVEAWTSITCTRDNQVLIGLCRTADPAWLVQFDDASQSIVETRNVETALHDEGDWRMPHAKIHSHLVELSDGWVYGGTHLSEHGDPKTYPGGHWFRYDPRSRKMEDLGLAMAQEGLIALQADEPRGCLYAITYPGAYLLRFDLVSRATQVLGKTSRDDEVNRAFFVLGPGNVYANQVYSPASQPGGIYVFDAAAEDERIDVLPIHRKADARYTDVIEKDAAYVYNYWLAGITSETGTVAYTTGYYSGHFVSLHLGPNGRMVIRDHGLTVPDVSSGSRNEARSGPFSQGMCIVGDGVLFTVALGQENSVTAEVRLLRYDIGLDAIHELGVIRTKQGQPVTNCTALASSGSGQLYLVGKVPGQESVVLLRIALKDVLPEAERKEPRP